MQPSPEERELRSRTNLALSLLNHRPPSIALLELIHLILLGASVQDLFDIERADLPDEFGDAL